MQQKQRQPRNRKAHDRERNTNSDCALNWAQLKLSAYLLN